MSSKNFKVALQLVGAKVNTVFYPGKSHTDLFLQVCDSYVTTGMMSGFASSSS